MNQAKQLRYVVVAMLAFVVTWTLGLSPARAETESWEIRSSFPYLVQLEFYSQDRKGFSWPGRGKAFVLDDAKTHTFKLQCNPGERICYGAWNVTTADKTGTRYWGVGQNSKYSCTDCCWTCGRKGAPRAINLSR